MAHYDTDNILLSEIDIDIDLGKSRSSIQNASSEMNDT